jgi:hypothetical protein
LEEERGKVKPVEDDDANDCPYATAEELEQMSSTGEVYSLVQLARKRNYALLQS